MNPRTQRLLEAQAETARTINRLMLTLLGLGLASTLTVGFPDTLRPNRILMTSHRAQNESA